MMQIREKRLSLGISQKELAEKLNVSQQAVSMWETGAKIPRTENLIRIAEICDCTVDELLKAMVTKNE